MADEKDRGISEDRLRRLKAYMRIVEDDDDELIIALYHASADYLASAGITEPEQEGRQAKYELAVFGLTLGYYDSRDIAPFS